MTPDKTRRMLIDVLDVEVCRIAIVSSGKLEEYYFETLSETKRKGNIYRAKVLNIEPAIQAAFLDIGEDQNGFLHISDVAPWFSPLDPPSLENKGRGKKKGVKTEPAPEAPKHDNQRRKIQDILRPGQEILVQVTRDGIAHKGPTVSTYISLAGRYLVLMPGTDKSGVSRKISQQEDRKRLMDTLEDLQPPKGMGFIIRTAGVDRAKSELKRDFHNLTRLWETIRKKSQTQAAPCLIHQDSDMVARTLRDHFSSDIEEVLINSDDSVRVARTYFKSTTPSYARKVKRYKGMAPLFHRYGIEDEIKKLSQRKVKLPCGGHIVIDQTEAMTAIDINSGRFMKSEDPEKTAFRVNSEAAVEIPRQLRMRDLGGLILIDFIDMQDQRKQKDVVHILRQEMRRDKARHRILPMSKFCIVEMTRQRISQNKQALEHEPCPTCKGKGITPTVEGMGLALMRRIRESVFEKKGKLLELSANPLVASFLQNRKRAELLDLENSQSITIHIHSNPQFGTEQFDIRYPQPQKNGQSQGTTAVSQKPVENDAKEPIPDLEKSTSMT